MIGLHNINPMVRAIGTMGAVAALVGAVTFAQTPSNTVTLTDNALTATTAALGISADQSDTTCATTPGMKAAGMSFTDLQPGVASAPYFFCLDNTGGSDLSVSVSTPTNFTTSTIPAGDVTLNFYCPSTSTTASATGTLSSLASPLPLTTVDTGTPSASNLCSVTATLSTSYTMSGGSVTPFELDFSGTTTT